MTTRFSRKRAVVTGASRGIGAGIARRLAAEGADVVLVVRTRIDPLVGDVEETRRQLLEFGGTVEIVVADLTDESRRAQVVPEAATALGGHIEILVNNAAAAVPEPITTMPPNRQRPHFEVNVFAPLALSQAVIPAMRDAGEGWIVNITSGAAHLLAGPPYPHLGGSATTDVYGSSKAALNRITSGLAAATYGTGIRVNAIQPRSAVATEAMADIFPGVVPPEAFEPIEGMVEAVVALCDCPAEHTGRIEVSLDLLAARSLMVHHLDGSLLEHR
jgi:NAD(P)-dependent dehydrogenase (short-subunit alcohol dehydrogenase family)